MAQKPVLREWDPSDPDFDSTSSLFLQCSIDSRAAPAKFEWIDYCPAVFRNLQGFGEIDIDDYMDSIRGRETLGLLISPKKNNHFCLQHDDRFIIKILSKSEMKAIKFFADAKSKLIPSFLQLFLERLPKYYQHLQKYRSSLLTKYYGLHVVKPQCGQKVRFVVIQNILQSDLSIHKQFNLRVSSHGRLMRKGGDEEDLNIAFQLHASVRHQLATQIKNDCNFLEEIGITNYGLLLGIHVCPAPFEAVIQGHRTSRKAGSVDLKEINSDCPDSVKCDAVEDMSTNNHSESSSPSKFEGKLGVRMAARAINMRKKENCVASFRATGKEPLNNIILYFGIINILQGQSMLRHVEHVLSPTGLVVYPKTYSTRFQEYLGKIFPEEDSGESML